MNLICLLFGHTDKEKHTFFNFFLKDAVSVKKGKLPIMIFTDIYSKYELVFRKCTRCQKIFSKNEKK